MTTTEPTVQAAQQKLDAMVLRVAGLRSRRAELLGSLHAISDQVKEGKADRMPEVATISAELATTERELTGAEETLRVGQREAREAVLTRRFAQLETVVAAAQAERRRFTTLYCTAAESLHAICELAQEALTLSNVLGVPLQANLLRERVAAIAAMPDPELSATHVGAMGHGYNWAVRIVPLRSRFQKSQEETTCQSETTSSK